MVEVKLADLKILVLYFLLIFNTVIVRAQDSTYIKWVGQFPQIGNKEKTTITKKRIARILFGKNHVIISKPLNVLGESPEEFWILDQGSGKIIHIDKNSIVKHRFLDKQLLGFTSLVGICSMPNDDVLFTDSHLHNIYSINVAKKEILPLNDSLKLNRPTGIAYSKVNNEIWVVETGAHRISVLNKNGEIVKTIGERGNGIGEFNFPTFIWIDELGNVYVVDSMNFRIQIFNKNGEFVSTFGKMGDATGYFARPKGIATDAFGNIYVADALFHVIQIFDKSGNFLYRFGEQGQGQGQFWMPTGIFIDGKNYIYVADSYNSRVQIFQLVNGELQNNN